MITEKQPIICDYCKKEPPKKVDCWSTWFGRYSGTVRTSVVCIVCWPDKKKEWTKFGK